MRTRLLRTIIQAQGAIILAILISCSAMAQEVVQLGSTAEDSCPDSEEEPINKSGKVKIDLFRVESIANSRKFKFLRSKRINKAQTKPRSCRRSYRIRSRR